MTQAAEAIRVGEAEIAVWPEGQQIVYEDTEKTVYSTRFADTARYHPRLVETILRLAADPEIKRKYAQPHGGTKIYNVASWDCPAARLVDARARALFRRVLKSDRAAVDNSWANVYRAGDFIMPHSHLRALASLVYILDPGDPVAADDLAGRFAFVDPRYGACCRVEPGRMTNPMMPQTDPGLLLLFPGSLVHCVNPYKGERPRITLSWNMNREALAGSRLEEIERTLAADQARQRAGGGSGR